MQVGAHPAGRKPANLQTWQQIRWQPVHSCISSGVIAGGHRRWANCAVARPVQASKQAGIDESLTYVLRMQMQLWDSSGIVEAGWLLAAGSLGIGREWCPFGARVWSSVAPFWDPPSSSASST